MTAARPAPLDDWRVRQPRPTGTRPPHRGPRAAASSSAGGGQLPREATRPARGDGRHGPPLDCQQDRGHLPPARGGHSRTGGIRAGGSRAAEDGVLLATGDDRLRSAGRTTSPITATSSPPRPAGWSVRHSSASSGPDVVLLDTDLLWGGRSASWRSRERDDARIPVVLLTSRAADPAGYGGPSRFPGRRGDRKARRDGNPGVGRAGARRPTRGRERPAAGRKRPAAGPSDAQVGVILGSPEPFLIPAIPCHEDRYVPHFHFDPRRLRPRWSSSLTTWRSFGGVAPACGTTGSRSGWRRDGREAIELYTSAWTTTRSTCVLLDVQMPGLDGPGCWPRSRPSIRTSGRSS